ncbi:MAG TPA: type I restriction enzyme HsdR N-terminal domain-containing protein [Chitinophagaceae bacterium]|nr:type I restriction enzyme HsdR N-terminal domain-containing protein [Chitinophagaceae bacterium]
MININYPAPAFRLRKEGNKEFLFDPLRKKWLLLTPEEWVRQNFVQYLVRVKNYPSTLIAMEKEIWLGELKKRFDVLVYDRQHRPWMMIECKEMRVPLNEEVLQQVLRYNISIPVNFIMITNGNQTYGWEKSGSGLIPLDEVPVFSNEVIN